MGIDRTQIQQLANLHSFQACVCGFPKWIRVLSPEKIRIASDQYHSDHIL